MRHVHARAFVADVDDAHLALCQVIPDRLDMPALQPVDALRTAGHDELGDPFRHRLALLLAHAEPLAENGRVADAPRASAARKRDRYPTSAAPRDGSLPDRDA